MSERDPLAVGLGALASGVGLGGATITLMQIVVKQLEDRTLGADPLLAGLLAGVVIAALFGWRRSTPLGNIFQSGVIGVLSAAGALLVGFLAAVADRFGGTPGLVFWGVASTTFGVVGSRWAVKGAGDGTRETGDGRRETGAGSAP